MSRPVVLVVDDSSEVTCQMADDLRANFRGIHVLTANSESKGREIAQRLKKDHRRLALLIAEIGCCSDLAREVATIHPEAKRALLTVFEQRAQAIQAMNEGQAHYYIVKPWQPPNERLWPLVGELLDDWSSANDPKTEPIRVYGLRWASESHEIKEFLARNQAPYEWIDVFENDDAVAKSLVEEDVPLPVVVLSDGSRLTNPSVSDLAEQIGLKTEPDSNYYDLAVVGAGPAGLAAAVYAASEGLRTLVLEQEAPGGQAGCSSLIENYLGFPQGLTGADLARRATDQALRFHAEILSPQQAIALRRTDGYRVIRLANGKDISARAVLLAMGVSYRRLECAGEDRLFGKGVYYGASYSEALECEKEEVCIVGGGNSAGQAAMHFAQYASKVTLLAREQSLDETMSHYLIQRIQAAENIEILTNSCVDELRGEDRLKAVVSGDRVIECSSVFVFIGADPRTEWLPRDIARDENGYLLTGNQVLRRPESRWALRRHPTHLETSMPGVFAAGDVRSGAVKRIASAVGQGAAAVQLVHEYLAEIKA